jgi:hypothetical protein
MKVTSIVGVGKMGKEKGLGVASSSREAILKGIGLMMVLKAVGY